MSTSRDLSGGLRDTPPAGATRTDGTCGKSSGHHVRAQEPAEDCSPAFASGSFPGFIMDHHHPSGECGLLPTDAGPRRRILICVDDQLVRVRTRSVAWPFSLLRAEICPRTREMPADSNSRSPLRLSDAMEDSLHRNFLFSKLGIVHTFFPNPFLCFSATVSLTVPRRA